MCCRPPRVSPVDACTDVNVPHSCTTSPCVCITAPGATVTQPAIPTTTTVRFMRTKRAPFRGTHPMINSHEDR